MLLHITYIGVQATILCESSQHIRFLENLLQFLFKEKALKQQSDLSQNENKIKFSSLDEVKEEFVHLQEEELAQNFSGNKELKQIYQGIFDDISLSRLKKIKKNKTLRNQECNLSFHDIFDCDSLSTSLSTNDGLAFDTESSSMELSQDLDENTIFFSCSSGVKPSDAIFCQNKALTSPKVIIKDTFVLDNKTSNHEDTSQGILPPSSFMNKDPILYSAEVCSISGTKKHPLSDQYNHYNSYREQTHWSVDDDDDDDDDDGDILLCQESMDGSEFDDLKDHSFDHGLSTPPVVLSDEQHYRSINQKKQLSHGDELHSQEIFKMDRKCRKKLEKLFEETKVSKVSDSSILLNIDVEMDRYSLFYNQMLKEFQEADTEETLPASEFSDAALVPLFPTDDNMQTLLEEPSPQLVPSNLDVIIEDKVSSQHSPDWFHCDSDINICEASFEHDIAMVPHNSFEYDELNKISSESPNPVNKSTVTKCFKSPIWYGPNKATKKDNFSFEDQKSWSTTSWHSIKDTNLKFLHESFRNED